MTQWKKGQLTSLAYFSFMTMFYEPSLVYNSWRTKIVLAIFLYDPAQCLLERKWSTNVHQIKEQTCHPRIMQTVIKLTICMPSESFLLYSHYQLLSTQFWKSRSPVPLHHSPRSLQHLANISLGYLMHCWITFLHISMSVSSLILDFSRRPYPSKAQCLVKFYEVSHIHGGCGGNTQYKLPAIHHASKWQNKWSGRNTGHFHYEFFLRFRQLK